ncbi:hypothetical protein [Streptomyces sp. WG-D5]
MRKAVLDAGRTLGVPESVTVAFAGQLRPCVHLCAHGTLPEDMREGARPVGRAAGLPHLPPGTAAATGSLPHILTIDCAAVPPGVLDIDFPADGQLVVFAEISDYPGEGIVLHVPAGTETVEHEMDGVDESDRPAFHEPFALYAVPGMTGPGNYELTHLKEALEYVDGDSERERRVKKLTELLDGILYHRWTNDIQLGGHSRAWQNPVEERGDVLFLRIPEGAVCEGDHYLTLIAGTRELLAERRYDDLAYEVEL